MKMKRLLFLLLVLAACITLWATNTLDMAAILANRYALDMQTPAGRMAWHGRLHHEIVDTNALVKTEVYSNQVTGAVWAYQVPFSAKVSPAVAKAQKTAATETKGIPSALAKARARRAAEKNTISNVTVTVEATK